MEDPEAVAEPILCPFCGYKAEGDYQIMLHMETQHPENGESPFVATDDASVAALMSLQGEDDVQYVNCPVEGCGEALLLTELDSHVEMHEEEGNGSGGESDEHSSKRLKIEPQIGNFFDTKLSYALRNLDDPSDDGHTINEKSSHDLQTAAKNTWKSILKMPDTSSKTSPSSKDTPKANSSKKRLGKSELGPHAHEKQMPAWLVKLLKEKDGEMATIYVTLNGKQKRIKYCPNQTAEILPVIEQFLEQDEATSYAYTCDPAIRHVSKLKREGGFCGYRNIQVMCSYIIGAQSQGHEIFNGKIPTIFDIQEYIESAWDMGINSQGRVETGGIRGTRKYIGTPDAQAMFCSLGIACDAQGIKPKVGQRPAYELLFTAVENYFINGCTDYDLKVRTTTLPPIYFQHPGHSLTIVGFEKQKDGTRNLIVFDPMFHDAVDIVKLIGMDFKHKYPGDKLRAYRRGTKYLKKYNEFELLKLTPPKRPEVIEAAITEQGV